MEENRMLPPGEQTPPASYWAKTAVRYRRASHFIGGTAILFSLLFLLLFTAALRYDSFFYFFRDVRTAALTAERETVSFSADESANVLVFKGGAACVSASAVEIVSADGQTLFTGECALAEPCAVASRKYLIAYDFGGTDFYVYNAYAEVYHGKADAPVYAASACDEGSFLLITGTAAGGSQILWYDKDFNLIQRFSRAGATVSAALTPNGKHLALAVCVSSGVDCAAQIDLFDKGKTAPQYTLSYAGELPLGVSFLSGSRLACLTDGALRVLTRGGKTVREITFDGRTPTAFSVNGGCCAVSLTDHTTFREQILLLNKKGKTLVETTSDGAVTGLSAGENGIFWLEEGRALYQSSGGGKTAMPVAPGACGIAALAHETAYVFYGGAAVPFEVAS